MTDATKYKSIMLKVGDYHLLKDLAAFQRQSMAEVLSGLIRERWDKAYPPKPVAYKMESTDVRRKNPFLSSPTNVGVD